MSHSEARAIVRHPGFVSRSRAVAGMRWGLTFITIAAFFALLLLGSLEPQILALHVGRSVAPLGFVLALSMPLVVVALTWAYVHRARTVFDSSLTYAAVEASC